MAWYDEEATLTNVVILGRAAPEELSDGRQTTCTGAWCPERGFIRLYPVKPRAGLFKRWDRIRAEVERNPDDTRHESWKIKGRKPKQEEKIEVIGRYPREKRATLLNQLSDECVEDISSAKRSLGIVSPDQIEGIEFVPWEDDDTPGKQAKLFEEIESERVETRDEFPHNIKVKYECESCKTRQGHHRQTLLEWGAYIGSKKVRSTDQLERNYRLNRENYRHWLFVGNMNQYKSQFIVISLIPIKDNVPINSTLWQPRKKAPDFVPADQRT